MRDTRAKTVLGLAAAATIILSALFMIGTLGGTSAASPTPASPIRQDVNQNSTTTAQTATPTSTNTTRTPEYPTTLKEQLSSVVVSAPTGLAKGIMLGIAEGHAYGIVKQAVRSETTMINDTITVTATQGLLPGTIDRIELKAFFDGSSTPYCTVSTTFSASGLTSYTTSLMCKYMGAGTYNFKVTVYDDNGNVIGDPTTTMEL